MLTGEDRENSIKKDCSSTLKSGSNNRFAILDMVIEKDEAWEKDDASEKALICNIENDLAEILLKSKKSRVPLDYIKIYIIF